MALIRHATLGCHIHKRHTAPEQATGVIEAHQDLKSVRRHAIPRPEAGGKVLRTQPRLACGISEAYARQRMCLDVVTGAIEASFMWSSSVVKRFAGLPGTGEPQRDEDRPPFLLFERARLGQGWATKGAERGGQIRAAVYLQTYARMYPQLFRGTIPFRTRDVHQTINGRDLAVAGILGGMWLPGVDNAHRTNRHFS
jgi:hypothetical protein